jgi:hypothetical protein
VEQLYNKGRNKMLLSEVGYNQVEHDEGIDLIKQEKFKSISVIINNLVSLYKYLYNVTPYDINCGMCEDFGQDILDILNDSEAKGFWEDELIEGYDYEKNIGGTHYFIRYKGRFYDSECPNGVDTWKQLPLFVNNAALEKVGAILDR